MANHRKRYCLLIAGPGLGLLMVTSAFLLLIGFVLLESRIATAGVSENRESDPASGLPRPNYLPVATLRSHQATFNNFAGETLARLPEAPKLIPPASPSVQPIPPLEEKVKTKSRLKPFSPESTKSSETLPAKPIGEPKNQSWILVMIALSGSLVKRFTWATQVWSLV